MDIATYLAPRLTQHMGLTIVSNLTSDGMAYIRNVCFDIQHTARPHNTISSQRINNCILLFERRTMANDLSVRASGRFSAENIVKGKIYISVEFINIYELFERLELFC